MNRFPTKLIGATAVVFIALMALPACGFLPPPFGPAPARPAAPAPVQTPTPTESPSPTPAATATLVPAPTNVSGAATLRVTLQRLLAEHVALFTNLSASAFDGHDTEFKAINATLDANSVELSRAIGQVYGSDTEKNFLGGWRKHIGLLIDYNAAIITKDKTKQDKAVADLNDYAQSVGTMLSTANPKLSKDAVTNLFKTHVTTIKDVIDAQSARDWTKAFTNARKAFAYADSMATPLALGIASQYPDKYDGRADASGANLRTSLNALLSEHVYLLSAATRAAVENNQTEFKAASDALDASSVDLSKALGNVYSADVEKNFLAGWRKHIGFVVDYTQGVIAKDKAKQDKAVNDLNTYASELGAFLDTTTSKNFAADAATSLVKTHVQSLKDLVDAQFAKDYAKAFTALHGAFVHMFTIADPLADAIVKQYPDKYK